MAEQVRAGGVGVDTHRDFHVGAVVDDAGRLLGSDQFRCLCAAGRPDGVAGSDRRVGVGGTGSYGAGLARHLTDAGVSVWWK